MKDSIIHQHILAEDWRRELQFFSDELIILRKRLDEVAARNTGKDLMAEIEHYENKFKVMTQDYDELLHDVGAMESSLKGAAVSKPRYINTKMVEANSRVEDLMRVTSSDFYETRHKFYAFLAKVL